MNEIDYEKTIDPDEIDNLQDEMRAMSCLLDAMASGGASEHVYREDALRKLAEMTYSFVGELEALKPKSDYMFEFVKAKEEDTKRLARLVLACLGNGDMEDAKAVAQKVLVG